MSVFDAIQNNRGRDDVGVYMAYSTYEKYLLPAQQDKVDEIVKRLDDSDSACADWAIAIVKGK